MRSRIPLQVGVVIAVLVTVALAVVLATRDAFEEAERSEAAQLAQVAAAVGEATRTDVNQVGSVVGLFESSQHVDLDEFQVFASRILRAAPSLEAVAFIARVRRSERSAYERRLGRSIVTPSGAGVRPAPVRDVYFPITYDTARPSAPESGRPLAGLDVGTDPERREAIDRAGDTGLPAASAPVALLRRARGPGVIVYVPIYGDRGAAGGVAARRASLEGFAVGVLRLEHVEWAVRAALPPGMRFSVVDAETGAPVIGAAAVGSGPAAHVTVTGRRWQIVVPKVARTPPLLAYVLLAAGALLAGLLSTLFVLSARRERYAEGLVARRLRERDAAEAALAQSEERMRSIVRTAADAIVIADLDGRVVGWNPAATRAFGWAESERIGNDLSELLPGYDVAVLAAGHAGSPGAEPAATAGESTTAVALHRDGSEVPVELTLSKWRGHDGAQFVTCIARDVSERRVADERLRESEAAFRLLAEHSTDVIVRFSPDCTFLYASPASREVLGREPEELVGRRLFDLVHPDDLEDVQGRQGTQPDGNRLPPLRVRLRHRSGRYVWVESTGRAILDEAGALVEFRVGLRDVSARVADQVALEASAERHRAISAQAPVGIFETDPAGRCTWVNERWYDVTGLGGGESSGAGWLGGVHPGDRARVAELWAAFTAGRDDFSTECRLARADGRVTWVAAAAAAMHDAHGILTGYLATATDITARVRAQERLHEAEERVRLAFARSPIGLALVSVDPDSPGDFIQVNPALCEITGNAEDVLRTRNYRDLVHPDDLPGHCRLVDQLMGGQCPSFVYEERLVRDDGEIVRAELSAALATDAAGQPLYAIALVQDVSERYELDRMKDEFLALASHELRTPLTSVLGYLQLVLDGEAGALNAEQRRLLGVAERRGTQLAALVADIHTMARADAGRLQLDRAPLDVTGLVADLVEGARPAALEREIALRLDPTPAPLIIHADHTRLAQVIDNLLSNALKFTPRHGAVTVSVAPRGERLAISVSDTGVGIPEDERAQLFQRFFRTRSATRGAVPGTGLGLAIARTIVESHGGAISVASGEAAGSVFTVELPVMSDAPVQPAPIAVGAG